MFKDLENKTIQEIEKDFEKAVDEAFEKMSPTERKVYQKMIDSVTVEDALANAEEVLSK